MIRKKIVTMTIRCAVKGCSSIYSKGCNKHFFLFPVKNAELLKKWIAAIGQDFQPSTASRVCCLHFETSDFIDTPGIRRKILKSNIFPTRNLTYSEGIQNNPLSDLHEAIEIQTSIASENIIERQSTDIPASENIIERQSTDIQSISIITNTDTNIQSEKCKACDCDFYSVQIKKLKEENKELRELQEEQNTNHIKELQKQKEVFKDLLKKEKEIMQKKLDAVHIKSKLLVRKTKRKDVKIKNLSALLDGLKEKGFITQTILNTLKQDFSNTILPIVQNEFSNRTIMMLPYPSSLRHLTFTVNVSPGFLSEVLQALEQVPCEDKDCTLIFDAMSIWQQLCWSEVDHRYISYCNYGNNFNFEGNEIEAKEVLVFMVVSLKGKWKWPIAYFFKTGMLSATLAELIKTALILTSKAKLKGLLFVSEYTTHAQRSRASHLGIFMHHDC